MKSLMMKSLVGALCTAVVAGSVCTVHAKAVLPGYLTDPTAVKGALAVDKSYRPPERLKYPYISTYYVQPTVKFGDTVRIPFFVTDFESSKIRFLDDSHRFTVFLEYRLRGGESKKLMLKNLKSGDSAFSLGALPIGDYETRIWATDAKGRESHRVIHDFRVVDGDSLRIPADKVYRMTSADLSAYGIRNDGDLEKIVYVDDSSSRVVKEKRKDAPGYTVTVPLDPKTGKPPIGAWKKAKVDYDAGYDRDAVEAASVATSDGLQKFLDAKAAAGFRKVVLLPGVYRVSHARKLVIPAGMTLDLGNAVLKQNAFTGASSLMVNIASGTDTHLVGGTLEGDYWTHDYQGSPNNSEWPAGFQIGGDSWYCSVENVKVVDITGYGGQNGISRDHKGDLAFFVEGLPKFSAGGLDAATGGVVPDPYRFTTDFKDLNKILAKGRTRLQVSRYLGYQGVGTRSWQVTVAWYDAARKFISAETAWQYREMWIPADAAFLRVSVEAESEKDANDAGLRLTAMRLPVNCAVKNCTFDHCRCVGYAASAMKNFLFYGNTFTLSGESAACCAFDAEDGWDQMQDVYFLKNVFRDNPRNNSILTCAGHNFILEENEGDVYFWGRTHSACVRKNKIGHGTYRCDSRIRSGYGRFDGNSYDKGVVLGENEGKNRADNWDYVLSGLVFDGVKDTYQIDVGHAGRMVNCTFRNVPVRIANAYACTFKNCTDGSTYKPFPGGRWFECTVKDSKFSRFNGTNNWERCHFTNTKLDKCQWGCFSIKSCDFTDCAFWGLDSSTFKAVGSRFDGTVVRGGYWEKPADVLLKDCTISNGDSEPFLKLGVYTIGRIGIDGCTYTGKKSLVDVFDLRPISLPPNVNENPDSKPGAIAVRKTRVTGGANTAVTFDRGGNSSKKIVIYNKGGNTIPDGLVSKDGLPSKWELK